MASRRESAGSSAKGLGVDVDPGTATHVLSSHDASWESSDGKTLDCGDPAVHCAVHVPRFYESGYAYPLVVWFHDEGGDEQEVLRVLPLISGRNYAGLSLRGPLPVTNGLPRQRRWSFADNYLNLLEDELAVGLQHAVERVNIHLDRVVVAGMGQGATLALRMLLRRPEWFAGAACLGGEWTADNRFEWWGQYVDKPVWLGYIRGWSDDRPAAAIRSARLLATAGFDVTTRVGDFDDADPLSLGAEIDQWMMQSLCPGSVIM